MKSSVETELALINDAIAEMPDTAAEQNKSSDDEKEKEDV